MHTEQRDSTRRSPAGLRERSSETVLIARAREALASGPLGAADLMGRVLALPGAPAQIAERIAQALLSRHDTFVQRDDGAWSLRRPTIAANRPWDDEPAAVPLSQVHFAVVDVETTGGSHARGHRLTEIAIVPVDNGTVGETFSVLVNPERGIPQQIVSLTGITPAMVQRAPVFGAISPDVIERLRGRVFVAHNATFDWRFVQTELHRSDSVQLAGDRLCTLRLARLVLPQLRRRSLDALCRYFAVENTARHRAGGDATATAHVLCRLLALARDAGLTTWSDLTARLDRRTSRARKKRSGMPQWVDVDPGDDWGPGRAE